MEVFKDLKEDMDKLLSEDHENRICERERMKTIKDIKVEFNKELIKIFFNKIIEENFSDLNMEVPIKVLEAYRISNRQDKKRNYSQHIIISTLTVTNNNNKKLQGKKDKPITIIFDFQWRS